MALGLPPKPHRHDDDDLPELRRTLNDRAIDVVEALLGGPPCERRGSNARWNDRGFSLVIAGEKRGLWHDKRSNDGGDLFGLIQRETGCDFPGAIAWTRDFLGGTWRDDPERRRRREAEDRKAKDEDKARAQKLAALLRDLTPIGGTPAEIYLHARGIIAKPWPASVRWSARERAAIFVSTLADGTPTALQRVMLGTDGRPVIDAETGKKRKLSLGARDNGAVRFAGRDDGPLIVAEGPETALAIATATGWETWSMLGAVNAKLDLSAQPRDRLLVIAADDDAEMPLAPSQRAVAETLKTWRRDGRRALAVWPHATRRHDKSDFADLLVEGGAEAVRRRFAEALDTQARTHLRKGLPLAEARAKLATLTRETVAALIADPWDKADTTSPPAALIAATLGLGKSETAIIEALLLIGARRGSVVMATPTHKLNGELLARARDMAATLGVEARIEMRLGREAIDPDGDGTTRMCADLEAVREVAAAGLDAQTTVCEAKKADGTRARCPHFDTCAFQRQRQKTADLWLVSHAALGHRRPTEVQHPALLIVDEAPIGALLRGIDGTWIVLGDGDLAPVPAGMSRNAAAAWEADRRELVEMRRRMADLAGEINAGSVTRAALLAVGIDAETARKGAGQAKALIARPRDLLPGMVPDERRTLLKEAAGNRALLREAMLYGELATFLDRDDGAEISGRVARVMAKARDGAQFPAWRITTFAKIAEGWRAPTLLLDATARDDYRPVLREAFPGLRDEIGGEVIGATPHLRVTVVLGRSCSKGAIDASPKLARKILAWTATRLRELDADAALGGRALLVCNAALEEKLAAGGLHSLRVELAHFNALRGRDAWREARLAVIAGRTMPPPAAVEAIAAAITGRAVERRIEPGRWYDRESAPLIVGGRVAGETARDRHPDPIAEAVRWQACEAELLQAAGRLRAVGRDADRPADLVLIGCPVPEGLEVDAAVPWRAPGPVEAMLALCGVAPLSAQAAAAAFPELWPSAEAAKKALARADLGGGEGHSPIETLHKGMSPTSTPGVVAWRFRLPGAGRRLALALVDPHACADPRAWLEARLGPLASLELLPDDPPPTPPPRPRQDRVAEVSAAASPMPAAGLAGGAAIGDFLLSGRAAEAVRRVLGDSAPPAPPPGMGRPGGLPALLAYYAARAAIGDPVLRLGPFDPALRAALLHEAVLRVRDSAAAVP